jgi:hypothetical protein
MTSKLQEKLPALEKAFQTHEFSFHCPFFGEPLLYAWILIQLESGSETLPYKYCHFYRTNVKNWLIVSHTFNFAYLFTAIEKCKYKLMCVYKQIYR